MNRYIVGYKNDEFFMISSLNTNDVFEEEVKKFNTGVSYKYEELFSKIDVRKGDYAKLLKDLKL